MFEEAGERIHPPTPRRRQQARAEGHVARSHDLVVAALLLAGLALLWYTGGGLARGCGELARQQWSGRPQLAADGGLAADLWRQTVPGVSRLLLPLLGVLLAVAVIGCVAQTGVLLLPGKLAPDLGRLNPLQGLARVGSAANGMRLVFGLLKLVAILAVAGWCLRAEHRRLFALDRLEPGPLAAFLAEFVLGTGVKMAAALVAVGILDYLYQLRRYERELQMTTAELREELRGLRVDPVVTSRRRHWQRQGAS